MYLTSDRNLLINKKGALKSQTSNPTYKSLKGNDIRFLYIFQNYNENVNNNILVISASTGKVYCHFLKSLNDFQQLANSHMPLMCFQPTSRSCHHLRNRKKSKNPSKTIKTTLLSQQHPLISKQNLPSSNVLNVLSLPPMKNFSQIITKHSQKSVPQHNLVKLSFYVLLATQG